ncbi:hypothetical protein [Paracoccus aestuariivivens]|uniref:Uncharacterized protein n=1 Tax=Paracoccus aestuariivivens TaxID=1820333 RepID=A0A6L6J2K0_9RHOB|nr:hypothetical protein [Paracoccus aestuariivivens]MTH76302.1 hypothetical protein [Paracoccus aestuariivivens]
MSMVQVDNRISTGNILVAGGMIVSIAVAWGNLSGRADNINERVVHNAASIAAAEARVRALETNNARQDERMILILDSLRKIEARIESE